LGYAFRQSKSLGRLAIGAEWFEVAGMIDKKYPSGKLNIE
jgi:hypothetical protein